MDRRIRTLTCIEGDCYEDMPLHINPGGMFDLTTYAVSGASRASAAGEGEGEGEMETDDRLKRFD